MTRHWSTAKRYVRQAWARRRELARPQMWVKAARIGGEFLQARGWPDAALARTLDVFESRPWNLHIETTNACNADCVFCAYQHMNRRKQIMSMQVYEKALADYVAMGGGNLMLTVIVGDPLLDPDFIEKVRMARAEPSIRSIETITNGIALDRLGVRELVTSGIDKVLISTAGFDRDSYVELYRTKKYAKMRDNVLDLLRVNRELGSRVEVTIGFRTNRSLKQVLSDPDFQPVKEFAPKIEFTFAFGNWQGLIDVERLPQGFVAKEKPEQHEPCAWLYDGPIVYANGDVGMCGCSDIDATSELVVGSILEHPLIEIWRSERVRRMRADFVTRPPAICSNCSVYRSLDDLRGIEGLRRAWLTNKRYRGSLCNGGSS